MGNISQATAKILLFELENMVNGNGNGVAARTVILKANREMLLNVDIENPIFHDAEGRN